MSEVRVVSAKLPQEVYQEMVLRIPDGDRSDFIREAIVEKLQKTPKANKILELEERMSKIENELAALRKYLADLELLTFGNQKVNPRGFCTDEIDNEIIEYLIHHKGATTPELADFVKINRWLVLNRLQRIQKSSQKQCGKSIIEYFAGEKSGKKKAWWINEQLIQEE
jgi:Arc/MetJ-type ribon-helix-helix transcriptional regulator